MISKPQEDLLDMSFSKPDMLFYVMALVNKIFREADYPRANVCRMLPTRKSAQATKLIALPRADTLAKGKATNIYTD